MASLIFAVGPQNAMLIKHGLNRDRTYLLATIFTLCDTMLLLLGIIGLGQIIAKNEILRSIIEFGGAGFLFWLSGKSFKAAWRGSQSLNSAKVSSHGTLVMTALAVSLLNPGAVIDTIVIVGSVSSQYPFRHALAFGLGAQMFSTIFFFMLAGFTRQFSSTLNKPLTWRIVDSAIGIITAWTGIQLLIEASKPVAF